MPTSNDVVQLWSDANFSSVWLAATNKKQYLQKAEQLNRTTNLMEICICVANVATNPNIPLEVSINGATGLVEIYRFKVQSLARSLRLLECGKISIKRKQVCEIEVHVKNRRLSNTFDPKRWDHFQLDFENLDDVVILTDDQIIEYLLTSAHNTTVQNVNDITIREAPPSRIYDEKAELAEDDFGPVTSAELSQLFLPIEETNNGHVPLSVEQPNRIDIDVGLLGEPNEDSRTSIQPLDVVGLVPVPVDESALSCLVDNHFPAEQRCENGSAIAVENEETNDFGRIQALINEPTKGKENTGPSKKPAVRRPTRISFNCYAQWNANYEKLQRKRPAEELKALHDEVNLVKMFRTPVRRSALSCMFERNAKVKRHKPLMDYDELEQQNLGKKPKRGDGTTPVAVTATDDSVAIPEPRAGGSDAPENELIGEIRQETPPPKASAGYVSEAEMLNLLHSLWEVVPDALPFEMVKTHIKNRLTAASVFSHILGLSARGSVRIVKGENGSLHSLLKGPHWV